EADTHVLQMERVVVVGPDLLPDFLEAFLIEPGRQLVVARPLPDGAGQPALVEQEGEDGLGAERVNELPVAPDLALPVTQLQMLLVEVSDPLLDGHLLVLDSVDHGDPPELLYLSGSGLGQTTYFGGCP